MSETHALNKPRSLITHAMTLPRWGKVVMTLATLLTAGGITGQAVGYFSPPAPQTQTSAAPGPHSSFAGDSSASPGQNQSEDDLHPLWNRLSPYATRIGLAFLVGFILGWAIRAFVKITSMILLLGLGAMLALSYFKILNIDFTKAEGQYDSAMHWVTDQGSRLAAAAYAHVPGSFSGFLGLFIGFRRK